MSCVNVIMFLSACYYLPKVTVHTAKLLRHTNNRSYSQDRWCFARKGVPPLQRLGSPLRLVVHQLMPNKPTPFDTSDETWMRSKSSQQASAPDPRLTGRAVQSGASSATVLQSGGRRSPHEEPLTLINGLGGVDGGGQRSLSVSGQKLTEQSPPRRTEEKPPYLLGNFTHHSHLKNIYFSARTTWMVSIKVFND